MKKMFFAVILVLLALSVVGFALAEEGSEPTSEVPYEWIHGIWAAAKAMPIAIITALFTCIAGYLSKTPPQNFKLENVAFTAIISFVISFLTVYAGWTYAQIELWLANGFLTWYIWKLAKR